MTKPIKPEEAVEQKLKEIPDEIIEVVNALIKKKLRGNTAIVHQDEIMKGIDYVYDRERVYENGWLDIEPLYQEAGWTVEYDKPGYNETYRAYFRFTKEK